ncbi:hypothetical protein FRB95_010939 [Tulasnella sp. JGI-2019a]|nr:hypothetical protein FRB95_010939 [Tulasnella sp. JGI-2019a]
MHSEINSELLGASLRGRFMVGPEHLVKGPRAIAIEKKCTRGNPSFGGRELLDFTLMKEAEKYTT